jgi:hypothetical protein
MNMDGLVKTLLILKVDATLRWLIFLKKVNQISLELLKETILENVVLKRDKWSWLRRCFDNTKYKS